MNNADYPVYQAIMKPDDNETGVRLVSIVDEPAIERYFIAMSKQDKIDRKSIHLSSDEKRIITGAVMVPDKLIYRNADENIKTPYYINFDAETILECAKKYFRLNSQNQSNVNHQDNKGTDGVVAFESWIVTDSKTDKSIALGMEEHPVGTWMLSYHVKDDSVWQKVKSGELRGFSLEGFFDYVGAVEPKQVNNQKQIDMNKILLALKEQIGGLTKLLSDDTQMAVEDWKLQDGSVLKYDPATEILTNADGTPVADGEYILQDGRTAVVINGKVTEVKEVQAAANDGDGGDTQNLTVVIAKTADGKSIAINSESGMAFEVDAESKPTETPLADGQYEMEDGTVIEVVGGKFTVMTAAQMKKMFEQQLQEMSTEYESTKAKIESLKSKKKELETELSTVKSEFDKFKTEFDGQKPPAIKTDNFEWAGEKKDKYKAASEALKSAFESTSAKKK